MIEALKQRFEAHPKRHPGIDWPEVERRLHDNEPARRAIARMEDTGGEPDVIGADPDSGRLIVCDCSPESPSGRRSLCYDQGALDARKENKPAGSAVAMAASMGIELLDEARYRHLQTLGEFDLKTSSWILTPAAIRKKGGALFCDRRYDHVFVYHNGAGSYYASRAFRGWVGI
ncbi:MAG: DUF4256 domain-containing protein [Burkholderiaceae bacterium]